MNPTQTNWLNLFGQYPQTGTTWHALTTSYSLGLSPTRSYQFKRKFSTNPDQTTVYHTNTYYSNGQPEEQSWQLDQQENSQSDGVFHPAAERMRAISFGNDTSIWVAKQFDPSNGSFGLEAFFQEGENRLSIIPAYQGRNLARFVMIKENTVEFPEGVNDEKITDFALSGSLTRTTMTPDLQSSTQELANQNIDLSSFAEGNETYFLPENIYLNLPGIIARDQKFAIAIGKQTTLDRYKQIIVKYDATGKLLELVSEVYNLAT